MSFDWRDFLSFAEDIAINDTAPSNRSGISRAYYAVFGHARLFCVRVNLLKQSELKSHNIHSLLIERLIDSDIEELNIIGARIDALKNRRKEADYEAMSRGVTNRDLHDTIRKSHEVLQLISNY